MNLQIGGRLGYRVLKWLSNSPVKTAWAAGDQAAAVGNELHGAAKLERFLGREVWNEFRGHRVLDFGCGGGAEAVAVAMQGAELVVGTDIQNIRLEAARRLAAAAGVADRCRFLHAVEQADEIEALEGTMDCAYSIDAFEHYDRPDQILATLHRMLAPSGRLLISFGPPWKNPYGSHTRFFCPWPWIHLLFREETVMAVRSLYRTDGAKRYAEVEGGLNQMTLVRFLNLVEESPFLLDYFRLVPLSSRLVNSNAAWQRLLCLSYVREFVTSVVQCRLVKPPDVCSVAPQCRQTMVETT